MSRLTDQELIEELKSRFEVNRKALFDLQAMTAQLEKMNRRLQESEAMKSHFLSNIRNEINNPLTSIIGLSRHLMGGRCAAQQQAEVAGMIYLEAFDLDYQLRNIFVAAELEAGEYKPEYANVDVTGLVNGTVELLSHQLDAKGLRVSQQCLGLEENHTFVSDAQMLQVTMINLLTNAIEYSQAGSEIVIVVQRSAAGLRLLVRDHGCGIDPALHERIFDRFQQIESGSTKGHRGHGLGLSIVKALAELLGGQVTVRSALGAGAEFAIDLPEPQVAEPVSLRAQDGNFFLFEGDEGSAEVF